MQTRTDIRPARASDADALFELARLFPTPTPPTRSQFDAGLAARLHDSAAITLVASVADRLAGYVAGYWHATFYAGGPVAWVDELFVEPSARGRGIGQRLMAAFEGQARASGCVLAGLATAGAAAFYENQGYRSRAGYYKKYLEEPGTEAT